MKVWVNKMTVRNLDPKGRVRNTMISFRVSKEELDTINRYVKASGMTKQQYLTSNMMNNKLEIIGNPRVHKALRNNMLTICDELKRINDCSEIDEDFREFMKFVFEIYKGMEE